MWKQRGGVSVHISMGSILMPPRKPPAPKKPDRITALESAIDSVIAAWPDQPVPLDDLCQAMANLIHVRNRTTGRPGPPPDTIDLVRALRGQGFGAADIAKQAGIGVYAVRRILGPVKLAKTKRPAKG
jgi:hypothetical protein